ncbi:CLP1-like protein [Schizophyllum commune]
MALTAIHNATVPRRHRATKCTYARKGTNERVKASTKRRMQPKFAVVQCQAGVPVRDAAHKSAVKPVALPRTLYRPQYQPISQDALKAVLPQCEDISPAFVQEQLSANGAQMWNTVRSTRVAMPAGAQVPQELPVVVNDASASAPTHIMAVHGPAASNGVRPVMLYPAHATVLAAHCARLPAFTPSPTDVVPETVPASMTMPVRRLSLPAPHMFGTVLQYLYEKDAEAVLQSFLPVALPNLEETAEFPMVALANAIAGLESPQALLKECIHRVHGLWLDVCALGIHDMALYATMDLAWDTLLMALAFSTRETTCAL